MGSEFRFIRCISTCVVILNMVLAYYAISNIVQTQLNPHLMAAQASITQIEQYQPQVVAALEGTSIWNAR